MVDPIIVEINDKLMRKITEWVNCSPDLGDVIALKKDVIDKLKAVISSLSTHISSSPGGRGKKNVTGAIIMPDELEKLNDSFGKTTLADFRTAKVHAAIIIKLIEAYKLIPSLGKDDNSSINEWICKAFSEFDSLNKKVTLLNLKWHLDDIILPLRENAIKHLESLTGIKEYTHLTDDQKNLLFLLQLLIYLKTMDNGTMLSTSISKYFEDEVERIKKNAAAQDAAKKAAAEKDAAEKAAAEKAAAEKAAAAAAATAATVPANAQSVDKGITVSRLIYLNKKLVEYKDNLKSIKEGRIQVISAIC